MRVSYLVAAAVAVLVAVWVLSGQIAGSGAPDRAEANVARNPAEAIALARNDVMTVRVAESSAVERTREIEVPAHTEVSRQVIVRAEVSGTVHELLVDKGDRVTEGQLLARLDLADRMARLAEAEALLKQRRNEHDITRSLVEEGHRPRQSLVAVETALESATATLERIQLEIRKTEIRAPFAGIIEDRQVQMGDVVSPGGPVALVVDEDPFLVVGNVPETDVAAVEVGGAGTARFLDATTADGTVRFIATVADPQTRTFRVELEVPNPDRTLRAGMTADLLLPIGRTRAHFVSPAALVLDDAGNLGVRTVGGDNVVEFHAARVVGADDRGVWLDGLPETVSLITVGHQFVKTGDRVRVAADPGARR